jgi:hypothetical protein
MIEHFREFEQDAIQNKMRNRKQIVVAVTANCTESIMNKEKFDEVFQKPIDTNKIIALVKSYIIIYRNQLDQSDESL